MIYNPSTDLFEVDFAFEERGVYRLVFNAEDASGQRAQPVAVTVYTGSEVYLPLLSRQSTQIVQHDSLKQ